jgi:hypothetical protein
LKPLEAFAGLRAAAVLRVRGAELRLSFIIDQVHATLRPSPRSASSPEKLICNTLLPLPSFPPFCCYALINFLSLSMKCSVSPCFHVFICSLLYCSASSPDFFILKRLRGGSTLVHPPAVREISSVVHLHPDEQKPEIHRSQSVLLINEVRFDFSMSYLVPTYFLFAEDIHP